jgi:hemerythrin
MLGAHKVKVCEGLYWVAFPEAGVYVQCGSPADSVKHLMKRGLIQERSSDGVTFETGPNVILLSDLMIQNGEFANLGEFPVLQMLYRQGMLLPGHPNNTGIRPLIAGSEDQVRAQLEYIRRGNYGLVSEEELLAAGVPDDSAREMMRMKLKFAFGRIRNTEDLLDCRIIGEEQVELRNAVMVRRVRLNVFEFEYFGETVTVDLNLPPRMGYPAPYPLGFHLVERGYFSVLHSGEGDGWDINRPCMASIVMHQGVTYLIDAGPNIMHSLKALGIGVNEIAGVFHTHCHDDHFCGLATLLRTDRRLKYFATPMVRASVVKKLCALTSLQESDFAAAFDVHDLEMGAWNPIAGLEVMPVFSPHPVETTVMLFRALGEGGYKTYGHYADIVSFSVLENMRTEDPEAPGVSDDFVNRTRMDYLQPMELKKLDIGGGLIHGDAADFRRDPTDKILLAHTARALSAEQKEIGSGAPFGMLDELWPSHQEYVRSFAYAFLEAYFPTVPEHELTVLTNNKVVVFNPESIIIKTGALSEYIYLVLTGEVEMLATEEGVQGVITSGGLVGEMAGLLGAPSLETYRASSFVQALRLPRRTYHTFVKRNGVYAEIERLHGTREFLQRTWLFGEAISYPVLNRVAKVMSLTTHPGGAVLAFEDNTDLHLVSSGQLTLLRDGNVVEELETGDFFGAGRVLYGTPLGFEVRTYTEARIYSLARQAVLDIPIVRWKLLETFERRSKL